MLNTHMNQRIVIYWTATQFFYEINLHGVHANPSKMHDTTNFIGDPVSWIQIERL